MTLQMSPLNSRSKITNVLMVHKIVLGQFVRVSLPITLIFLPSESFECRGTLRKKVLNQIIKTSVNIYFKRGGEVFINTK
jgi:hypothetical protein